MWLQFKRRLVKILLRLGMSTLFKINISGQEFLEQVDDGPLIIVSNHFSLFDPLFMMIAVPFDFRFFAAIELTEKPFANFLIKLFDAIPIWRGQVDRKALDRAREAIEAGDKLGVFPEGGVDPNYQARVQSGEQIHQTSEDESDEFLVRETEALIPARRGTVYLTANTPTKFLPMSMLGTQNFRKFSVPGSFLKRVEVDIRFGPVFGPLVMEEGLRGSAKKVAQEEMANVIMDHIANLLPEENRGGFGH